MDIDTTDRVGNVPSAGGVKQLVFVMDQAETTVPSNCQGPQTTRDGDGFPGQ